LPSIARGLRQAGRIPSLTDTKPANKVETEPEAETDPA